MERTAHVLLLLLPFRSLHTTECRTFQGIPAFAFPFSVHFSRRQGFRAGNPVLITMRRFKNLRDSRGRVEQQGRDLFSRLRRCSRRRQPDCDGIFSTCSPRMGTAYIRTPSSLSASLMA